MKFLIYTKFPILVQQLEAFIPRLTDSTEDGERSREQFNEVKEYWMRRGINDRLSDGTEGPDSVERDQQAHEESRRAQQFQCKQFYVLVLEWRNETVLSEELTYPELRWF